jgi:hypothetical protein
MSSIKKRSTFGFDAFGRAAEGWRVEGCRAGPIS